MTIQQKIKDLEALRDAQQAALKVQLVLIAQYASAAAANLNTLNPAGVLNALNVSKEVQALTETEAILRELRDLT
jgi:hypothetical protein